MENLVTFLLVSLDYERLLETVYDGDYWRLQNRNYYVEIIERLLQT